MLKLILIRCVRQNTAKHIMKNLKSKRNMFPSLCSLNFYRAISYIMHKKLFYFDVGKTCREIMERYRASAKHKEDIHTKLMKRYKDIPSWWFYVLLGVTLVVSLLLCILMKKQIQMPWWGLVFASALAFIFTLPISIITATTNQVNIFKLLLPLLLKGKLTSNYFIQRIMNTCKM